MTALGTPAKRTCKRGPLKGPCELCGEPIETGEVYRRWAWADDGSVQTVRVHDACETEARDCEWYFDEWPERFPLITERLERAR